MILGDIFWEELLSDGAMGPYAIDGDEVIGLKVVGTMGEKKLVVEDDTHS